MAVIQEKPVIEAQSSDKVMYYYKGAWEKESNPCHVLGIQGASSGTNTATLGTTATKQANIKDTGSINQQRVVNVVMTSGGGVKTDVARDLYYTWEHKLYLLLWRVDWNTLHKNSDGKQCVYAEFSMVKISALPETEALNTAIAQNVTFEVTGVARRYDDNGNPYAMFEEDFDDGMFSDVVKFYNFARPSQIGADDNGQLTSSATDDSKAGDPNGTVDMNKQYTHGGSSTASNQ